MQNKLDSPKPTTDLHPVSQMRAYLWLVMAVQAYIKHKIYIEHWKYVKEEETIYTQNANRVQFLKC